MHAGLIFNMGVTAIYILLLMLIVDCTLTLNVICMLCRIHSYSILQTRLHKIIKTSTFIKALVVGTCVLSSTPPEMKKVR